MGASSLSSLPLSPTALQARDEALRIARTQPIAQIKPRGQHDGPRDNWRDTIESIAIAFILAFIFRTFVCEAFIIPTGSMAETLYGRHKDVNCPQCKTRFRVGASSEVDRDNGYFIPSKRLKYGFCPNCRFQMDIEDELPFAGDRILVNKFPYEFTDPKRWEVVVFKFPGDPKISYIKRLIGLPGETISILAGDLYRQVGELGKAEILRKSAEVQQETQILVYDHDKPAKVLLDQGFPERWAPVNSMDPELLDLNDGWQSDDVSRGFSIDATQKLAAAPESWIRYRHYVPKPIDWQQALEKKRIELAPQLILIADHYSYNSGYSGEFPISDPETDSVGDRWVGDLTVSCEVEVQESTGLLTLELIEGRRKYHCDFDLASGRTTLSYQDESKRLANGDYEDIPIGEAQTAVGKIGKYKLLFANVDDRLLLSINGRWVKFQADGKPVDGSYEFPQLAAERVPSHLDLSPVGIAARQAKLRVSHLMLKRDIHYTYRGENESHDARRRLEDPDQYADDIKNRKPDQFPLLNDELLVLGDNSPCSSDSRWWNHRPSHPHALKRSLMIGKAFLIYWPHGMPFPGPRGFSPYLGEALNSKLYYWHEEIKERNFPNQPVTKVTDYPANTFPFYPQFGRWFKRIR